MNALEYINCLVLLGCFVVGLLLLLVPLHAPEKFKALAPIRWFGLGFVTFNVVAPFYLMMSGKEVVTQIAFTEVLVMSLVAGLAYLAGWCEGNKRPLLVSITSLPCLIPQRRLIVLGFLACLLGLMGTLIMIVASGTLGAFWHTAGSGLDLVGRKYYNVVCLLTAQYVVGLGITAYFLRRSPRKIHLWAVLVLLCLLFVLSSIKLGSRSRMMYGAFSTVFFLGLVETKRSARIWLLMAVLVLPLTIRYGYLRNSGLASREQLAALFIPGSHDTPELSLSGLPGSAEFDAFENGVYLVDVVIKEGKFLYGASFAASLINPIPRFLWPEKPVVDLVAPMRKMGVGKGSIENANIAVSLVAECYVNLWWLGIFITPFVLGYLASRLWRILLARSGNVSVGLLIVSLCVFSLMICRGSFTIIFTTSLMVAVLPGIMILKHYLKNFFLTQRPGRVLG